MPEARAFTGECVENATDESSGAIDPLHQLMATLVAEFTLQNLVDPVTLAGTLAAACIRLRRVVRSTCCEQVLIGKYKVS